MDGKYYVRYILIRSKPIIPPVVPAALNKPGVKIKCGTNPRSPFLKKESSRGTFDINCKKKYQVNGSVRMRYNAGKQLDEVRG